MKSRSKKATDKAESDSPEEWTLTDQQRQAYETVRQQLQKGSYASFLLYGVTGSGKTEVYMHLIREALKSGRSCIVLVPEISLTPQTVDRFYSRFGDCLAVIHSRLTQAHRVEEWHRIRQGHARVVVGARSAIFSPVRELGLIIIDEEHEASYKQDETPRYHAREVAQERARLEGAAVVLGSATPSLESYHATENGLSRRLELTDRIEQRPLPQVQIIDTRRVEQGGSRERIFSYPLEQAIKDSLAKKEQVMLLLNRRGFSTCLHCPGCGHVMRCRNCRVAMAYHIDKGALVCHGCHYKLAPPRLCPECQKSYLRYFGVGTQKVEQEAQRLFAGARIGRMDSDSTSSKDAHETILRAFKRGQIDLLIGTQMIAKGHDFANVSLIGVISADTALHIPDFRAAERTFSLLTQVAGRAGRGDIPGRVVVQTLVPTHYSVLSAKDHNYLEFYTKEIEFRRELALPPFTRLLQLVVGGRNEREVMRQVLELAKLIKDCPNPSWRGVVGPAPCVVSKQKGSFYWNMLVKGLEP
ncbi:MAG: primosomal protein N', partial [Candidatus Omnitrophota bacterium]